MDCSLFQTEVTDLKRIFHTYQAGSRNVLVNGDFSDGTLDPWERDGVAYFTFPEEPGNGCAWMLMPKDTAAFIRQFPVSVTTGNYLFAFRYRLNREGGGGIRARVGVADRIITLDSTPDGLFSYFFTVENMTQAGGVMVQVTPESDRMGRELFLDNLVFSRLPVSLLKNGDFEHGQENWSLVDAAIRNVPGLGHHLYLTATQGRDSYAEQSLDLSTASAGDYLVSFTLVRLLADFAEAEKGEVSLRGGMAHRFEFEFGEIGKYMMTFIFTLSAEEIAQGLTLRIAKLDFGPGLDAWFIDDVQMTAM